MASKKKRGALYSIIRLVPDRVGLFITRLKFRPLKAAIEGRITDKFLELLLTGMDLAFFLFKGYRKNIIGFEGTYLFRTPDNLVASAAIFTSGQMEIDPEGAVQDWDIRVTFKDQSALRDFIFSKDQDILNSILENKVEVDGNLNYLYKFGFMVSDLGRRLGAN
jgi:hypothetical protein